MKRYILDTSVVVKWFSKEEADSANAFLLRQQILEGLCHIIIPDLLIYELANALRYNPNFSPKEVQESLDSIFNMGLDVRKIDHSVADRAVEIAFNHNITIYDSYFLAVSQIEKKTL